MSPFLEQTTDIQNAVGQKYVSDGNNIYFAGPEDGYNSNHATLARKLGDTETDFHGKPFVVAAGTIFNMGGKFSFSVETESCHIKGVNTQKAIKVVDKVARKILGENRVY